MATNDWQDAKYQKQFEDALLQVEKLREIDPDFNIDSLRNMLETAYVHQGNNWTGRGVVGDVDHDAVIAGYEQAIAAWEKELEEENDS